MKEYHLHPDKVFIIRENNEVVGFLQENEISQFSEITLPQGCTEVLVGIDGIVYVTINKSMQGIGYNPISELIEKEQEIIDFYVNKNAQI
jgi:hypothetical protein